MKKISNFDNLSPEERPRLITEPITIEQVKDAIELITNWCMQDLKHRAAFCGAIEIHSETEKSYTASNLATIMGTSSNIQRVFSSMIDNAPEAGPHIKELLADAAIANA